MWVYRLPGSDVLGLPPAGRLALRGLSTERTSAVFRLHPHEGGLYSEEIRRDGDEGPFRLDACAPVVWTEAQPWAGQPGSLHGRCARHAEGAGLRDLAQPAAAGGPGIRYLSLGRAAA